MALLGKRSHENRPWGSFDLFTQDESTTVKIVRVEAGKRLSLQKHNHRAEFWHIISGSGTVEIDDVSHEANVGDEFEVQKQSTHRLGAGSGGLVVLEIAFGNFDESDIVRLADDFNRADRLT